MSFLLKYLLLVQISCPAVRGSEGCFVFTQNITAVDNCFILFVESKEKVHLKNVVRQDHKEGS